MIAEAGLAALWLAAALAALQLLGSVALLRDADAPLAPLVRPAAQLQALLCVLAFAVLIWLFAITDLSVALVANKAFEGGTVAAYDNVFHEGSAGISPVSPDYRGNQVILDTPDSNRYDGSYGA